MVQNCTAIVSAHLIHCIEDFPTFTPTKRHVYLAEIVLIRAKFPVYMHIVDDTFAKYFRAILGLFIRNGWILYYFPGSLFSALFRVFTTQT